MPSKKTFELRRGDRLLVWTSGGGGYGDPLQRRLEDVLDDVLDAKVSLEAAASEYGVVIRNDEICSEATIELRRRLRTQTAATSS